MAGALLAPLVASVPAQAVDSSLFSAGNIISDKVFYDTTTMSAADIQGFLNGKVSGCASGYTCLKDYTTATGDKPAVANRCTGYAASGGQSAATIIYNVSQSCGINPQVLIVLLQKEQGLVTSSAPSSTRYRSATGYGCPDTAACDSTYNGFFNQVYQAAYQFMAYRGNPGGYNYQAGRNNAIAWNPNPACGASTVYIENQATAGLYDYTPYRPNTAALANLYGTGDGCSSYGNRNFWAYFNDWFGSSTTDTHAPFGYADTIEGVFGAVHVGGWLIDPDSTDPVQYHVYMDGSFATAALANLSRPDVGAAYPADGPLHGYDLVVPASVGAHNVCVYAINIGPGYTNPPIRCASVTVKDPNPTGTLASATFSPGGITATGWAIDPESNDPIQVHVYVDGRFGAADMAAAAATSIPSSLSTYGANHGYSITVPVAIAGSHSVCSYAINVGLGSNVPLGCTSVVTMSGSPIGSLDAAWNAAGQTVIGGWDLDPDTTASLDTHVYLDGKFLTNFTASSARSDIASIFPAYGGAHGFTQTVTVPGGTHQLCVYGINVGPGSNAGIGCKTVVVKSGSPFGSLDAAVGVTGGVFVGGWAIDYDTTASIDVHVYIDGAFGGVLTASGSRPDVAVAYPGYGDLHGFSATIPAASGSHQVCVYGINQGPGANQIIRCAAVTVP